MEKLQGREGGQDVAIAKSSSLWMAITSVVLGVLAAMALVGDPSWDRDSYAGAVLMGIVAVVLGAWSLSERRGGRPAAIAGVVCGVLGALAALGSL